MNSPIYSNELLGDSCDSKIEKYNIPLLAQKTVDNINNKITFIEHGVYIFVQYKEEKYIVNGFAEDVFWNMVNALYKLIHDCDNGMLEIFLQTVKNDGKQVLGMFEVTGNLEAEKCDKAIEFIKKIKDMRIFHYHNMSPDDEMDIRLKKRVEKTFHKIYKKNNKTSNEKEWEKYIEWVCKNCENIRLLLEKRLSFFETNATELQKTRMCNAYYESIERYCDKMLYRIIEGILRKKRENRNPAYIQSFIKNNDDIIKEKAKELMKKAKCRVEPYHVIFEATETIMNQNCFK